MEEQRDGHGPYPGQRAALEAEPREALPVVGEGYERLFEMAADGLGRCRLQALAGSEPRHQGSPVGWRAPVEALANVRWSSTGGRVSLVASAALVASARRLVSARRSAGDRPSRSSAGRVALARRSSERLLAVHAVARRECQRPVGSGRGPITGSSPRRPGRAARSRCRTLPGWCRVPASLRPHWGARLRPFPASTRARCQPTAPARAGRGSCRQPPGVRAEQEDLPGGGERNASVGAGGDTGSALDDDGDACLRGVSGRRAPRDR